MSAGLRALDAVLAAVHAHTRTPGQGPVSLDTLVLPPALSVLVLAPHPDDFDAIAITLHRLHTQGMRLHRGGRLPVDAQHTHIEAMPAGVEVALML